MKTGRAFVAGMVGRAVMPALMWMARTSFTPGQSPPAATPFAPE